MSVTRCTLHQSPYVANGRHTIYGRAPIPVVTKSNERHNSRYQRVMMKGIADATHLRPAKDMLPKAICLRRRYLRAGVQLESGYKEQNGTTV